MNSFCESGIFFRSLPGIQSALPKLLWAEDEVILAMRATAVMTTNGDHGSWKYAGVRKTNASPDRISR
jgi:hypothetical protein